MGVRMDSVMPEETIFWRVDISIGYDCVMGWICANCGEKFQETNFGFERPNHCPSCGLFVINPDDEGGDG